MKLLRKLELLTGKKLSMKEISEQSHCDRSTLSRLLNHPDKAPSIKVIDQLVQFFFFALIEAESKQKRKVRGFRERQKMESIIKDFVTIYPDPEEHWQEYWEILPAEMQNDRHSSRLDTVWSTYERFASDHPLDRFKDPLAGSVALSLNNKLRSARDKLTSSGVEISLSEEEFNLLFNEFPNLIEKATEIRSDSSKTTKSTNKGKKR